MGRGRTSLGPKSSRAGASASQRPEGRTGPSRLGRTLAEGVARAVDKATSHAEVLKFVRRVPGSQGPVPQRKEHDLDPHGTIRRAREEAANEEASLNDGDPHGTIRAARKAATPKRR